MLPEPITTEAVQQAQEINKAIVSGEVPVNMVLLAICGGVVRTILSEDKRTFGSFIAGVFVAGFFGYISALGLKEFEISTGLQGAIVAVAAFSATDLLRGVMRLTQAFSQDPKKFIGDAVTIWRQK